jgi:hypothetical protein
LPPCPVPPVVVYPRCWCPAWTVRVRITGRAGSPANWWQPAGLPKLRTCLTSAIRTWIPGAVTWMHFCTRDFGVPKPARVALVSAPAPDLSVPECEEFFPVPLDIDGLRKGANGTVLVGSDNDPFCPQGVARTYGTPLKMAATVIPGGAHLNVASGHGPWPAMLDWCRRDNLAFIA